MGILINIIALVCIGVAVFLFLDARKLRARREAAVTLTHRILQRTEGILAGIRPSISDPGMVAVINDGLAAINKASKQLEAI